MIQTTQTQLKTRGFSLIGCPSGKSTQRTPPLTRVPTSQLTVQAQRFLSILAPRAYREAIQQAALLKVMVAVLWHQAISDGLIVKTTFSTLTRCKHYRGQTLPRSSQDFQLFQLTFTETKEMECHPLEALDLIVPISTRQEQKGNLSIYHVSTSPRILDVEALVLPGQSFGQYQENLSAG